MIKKFFKLILGFLIAFLGLMFIQWQNEKSAITVHFVDQNGTLLKVKNKTYHSKPYLMLSRTKLEKAVPGYTPVKKFIFFQRTDQKITVKFKPANLKREVNNFENAKFVAATFQPMTASVHHGWQTDPYNTARTYTGSKTGKDSLRLIYSNDGIKWKKMNISYPRLDVRDPSIAKIRGYWYIVYTKGLVRTSNFKKWKQVSWPHAKMFVQHYEWAPEFFKDQTGHYHIIMAGNSVKTHRFQLYVSDFNEKTGRIKNNWRILKGINFPGNMIDGNLTYYHGRYVLFYKNEDVAKNKLTVAVAKNYLGPYKAKTLNIDLSQYTSAEGVEAVFEKNKIRLYMDPYI